MANDYINDEGPLPRGDRGRGKDRKSPTFSKFESLAKRAAFQAETFGKSQEDKVLANFDASAADTGQHVGEYIASMTAIVRNTPVSELRAKAIPAIKELQDMVQKETIFLSDAEKKHIHDTGNEIIAFVTQKTTVFARLASSIKNTIRQSAVVDRATKSDSVLLRMAGRALQPQQADAAEQARLNVRAEAAKRIVAENQQTLAAEPEQAEPKGRKGRATPAGGGESGGGGGGSDMLPKILAVDTDILGELKKENENWEQEREARIRAEDDAKKPESAKPVRVPTNEATETKKTGSLLGDMLKPFGNLFDTLKDIAVPGLKMLGEGAAVVGAAWLGWKVGDWLSQMMGLGSSSEALAKLMDTSAQPIKSSLQSIGKTMKDLATTGKTTERLETEKAKAFSVNKAVAAGMMIQKGEIGIVGEGTNDMIVPDALYKKAIAYNDNKSKQHDINLPAEAPSTAPRDVTVAKGVLSMLNDNLVPAPARVPTAAPAPTPKPSPMRTSQTGIDALKKRESFVPVPYWDVKQWAIGYGDSEWNGKPLGNDPKQFGGYAFNRKTGALEAKNPPFTITKEQAESQLVNRLQKFENRVRRPGQTQNQFDALVSLAYNGGGGKSLADRAAAGESLGPSDFLKSATIQGKPNAALAARRMAEYEQFTSPTRLALNASETKSGTGITVVAPVTQTNVVSGGGGGGMIIPAAPITTGHPDETLQAMRRAGPM